MMFCPKCGTLLVPKKSKKQIVCSSCGYNSKDKTDFKISEEINEKESIEVVNQSDDLSALPLTDADCPKCKHKKARYWTTQTRAADEAETRFFRCENCGHVWRDAS